jgi:hypothetical protein
MAQLPVDIWWIILKMVWKLCYDPDFDLGNHNSYENSRLSYLNYENKFGSGITSDLYLMRCLCKTTKRMIDKYSRRYVYHSLGYENFDHRIFFPYEKLV